MKGEGKHFAGRMGVHLTEADIVGIFVSKVRFNECIHVEWFLSSNTANDIIGVALDMDNKAFSSRS